MKTIKIFTFTVFPIMLTIVLLNYWGMIDIYNAKALIKLLKIYFLGIAIGMWVNNENNY